MDKWISIKEKLPNELQYVLIYVPSYLKFTPIPIFTAMLCNWEKDICSDFHFVPMCLQENYIEQRLVSHWQPLPEPPKD